MRKIFIDAGSYKGDTVSAFINSKYYEPGFEIHCFEPDVMLYVGLMENGFIRNLYNTAITTYDGEVLFYPDRSKSAHLEKRSGELIALLESDVVSSIVSR